jgi:predicted permease
MHSDFRVIAFTLVAALASAIVFGLAPAIHTSSVNVILAARGDFTCQARPSQLRNILVAGQVTVCVLLLILTGILLRGVNGIHRLDANLSKRNTIEIAIQEKFREAVTSRLWAEPSVEIVGAAGYAPVERKPMISVSPADGGELVKTAVNNVSSEYFRLFEISIVRGRAFSAEEEHSGAPVALISQTAARRFWPNREALGHTLSLVPDARTEVTLPQYPVVTVIGITQDEISRWISGGEDNSLIYVPSYPRAAGNELFVGVIGDAEPARRKIDAELAAIDPDAVKRIQRLQIREWVDEDAYYTFRLAYWSSSAIGLLALVLTLSGVYGVLSYVISQRTKEIGIRMAMGASPRAVTNLVLNQSMRLAVIGAITGSVLATGVSKILASVLVMTNTFDIAAYGGGVILVLAACAAAAYIPSRRAARIDPLTALRYD